MDEPSREAGPGPPCAPATGQGRAPRLTSALPGPHASPLGEEATA